MKSELGYKSYYNTKTNKVWFAKQAHQHTNITINENAIFVKEGEWILKREDETQILSDAAFQMHFKPVDNKLLLD